ncbi:nucleotidyltransferase domain-containing protein [Sediminibacillus massiliensis]|uniref:nucleotidyltransferase domain-containing protein n=1 Tax=Sediminibacillus massiliensis TaxID=1926277 RepID=UPI0009887C0F|nr:nucleotidyltransferase domain-containing protein [Sediminibacillus massiliensis]
MELFKEADEGWLKERTILLARAGSYAHGTQIEGSDKDYKGICIPPEEYYLGLNAFNEFNNSGGRNFKNTIVDLDISITHLNKFVKDAMLGVPNNIELLFVRPEDWLIITDLGRKLIKHRQLFLSKLIEKKFGGYAKSQVKKMISLTGTEKTTEESSVIADYDTKLFMTSIRLLTSAIEILETGTYITYRGNRDLLLDCRQGKYSFNEALDMIEDYERRLKLALEETELPDRPDYQKVNRLLIDLNVDGLGLKR